MWFVETNANQIGRFYIPTPTPTPSPSPVRRHRHRL